MFYGSSSRFRELVSVQFVTVVFPEHTHFLTGSLFPIPSFLVTDRLSWAIHMMKLMAYTLREN